MPSHKPFVIAVSDFTGCTTARAFWQKRKAERYRRAIKYSGVSDAVYLPITCNCEDRNYLYAIFDNKNKQLLQCVNSQNAATNIINKDPGNLEIHEIPIE